MNHAETFFAAAAQICRDISFASIETLATELDQLRERKGRLFLIGVGGSAANCSHAVNDFRKLCGIETYSPVDNVSELTARTNDEGWDTVFAAWLDTSQLGEKDALLIYSVVPQVNPSWVTPLSEAFQAVVWHCLVSHPALQRRQTKW